MSLRIAFDMDGVLADLNAALAREALRLFPGVDLTHPGAGETGAAPAPADASVAADPSEATPPSLHLTSRQERALWDTIKGIENFWETLEETEPGIVRRLFETARLKRWEVIFLTSRPRSAGDIVQVQSQRWLERHGFALPALYVVSTSRGRIAQSLELDVVVDDRPENCLDIALDSKARAILIWRGDENAVPASARRLGIGGVSSVGACLDLLVEADSPDAGEAGGMMGRLRKLLRLKPSASTEPSRA